MSKLATLLSTLNKFEVVSFSTSGALNGEPMLIQTLVGTDPLDFYAYFSSTQHVYNQEELNNMVDPDAVLSDRLEKMLKECREQFEQQKLNN